MTGAEAEQNVDIVLVDYHKGNIKSVERALQACGARVLVTDRAEEVERAHAVVLPGVGAYTDAMSTLCELGLDRALQKVFAEDKPFLGICIGMHLMYEQGTEHAKPHAPTPGLGLIAGTVDKMPKQGKATGRAGEDDAAKYKIPHVGWNSLDIKSASPLFDGIDNGEYFYFTHSYCAPASAYTIATTTHSVTFPSAVQIGNAFGVQFHPEKSSRVGAHLLSNFVKIATKGRA